MSDAKARPAHPAWWVPTLYFAEGLPFFAVSLIPCTYSILPPSMDALAEALWGRIPFRGTLPVSLGRAR